MSGELGCLHTTSHGFGLDDKSERLVLVIPVFLAYDDDMIARSKLPTTLGWGYGASRLSHRRSGRCVSAASRVAASSLSPKPFARRVR
jgi:hypothetical protein